MSSARNRSTPRIRAELPVEIDGFRSSGCLTTSEISRDGVFVMTDSPKPLRQLLRIRIAFDKKSQILEAHGMVARITTAEDAAASGETAGMEVKFIALNGEPRERWEDYLKKLSYQTAVGCSDDKQVTSSPSTDLRQTISSSSPRLQRPARNDQRQTQAQHHQLPGGLNNGREPANSSAPLGKTPRRNIVNTVFPILIETPDQLFEIYERDLVTGTMFVCTQEKLIVGARVTMRIIHPMNKKEFDLHGKVRRLHDNPKYPGLSIALRPSTISNREKFKSFIIAGLPQPKKSPRLVDE